jgi:hypothetical protein
MWKMLTRSALGAAACLLATAGTAHAQDVLDVKIPFAFVVKGQSFPAGQYTIERAAMNESVLLIRGQHGNPRAMFVATRPTDEPHAPAGDRPAVQFTRHENQYRLSSVWESASDGLSVMN